MIVLFGSYKGGVGKSTIATNFASLRAKEGRDVLIVDGDRHGSAALWSATRSLAALNPRVTCVSMFGDGLIGEVKKIAGKFDDVIIDTAGQDTVELRCGMLVADLLVAPVQISKFDVAALEPLVEIITNARIFNDKLSCHLVANDVHTNKARAARQLRSLNAAADAFPVFRLAGQHIHSRAAYVDASDEGRGVDEYADKEASLEMKKLFAEVWHG